MPAPSFRAAGAEATGGNPTVPLPVGYQAGDLLLLIWAGVYASSVTTAGWTRIITTSGSSLNAAYKFAASTSETPPVLNVSAHYFTHIQAYSGVKQSGGVVSLGSKNTTSMTSALPTGSSAFNDALIVPVMHVPSGGQAPVVSASGLASFNQIRYASGSGGFWAYAGVKEVAGDIGSITAAFTDAKQCLSFTLALYPAIPISGVGTPSIPAITSTAIGALTIKAASSPTIAALQSAGTGKVSLAGQGDAAIGPFVTTSAATLSIGGSASIPLDNVTGAIEGVLSLVAEGGATLDPITGEGASILYLLAEGSVTLDDILGYGEGEGVSADIMGRSEGEIGPVILSTIARLAIVGEGWLEIPNISSDGAAAVTLSGEGAATIDDVVLDGAAGLHVIAASHAFIGNVTGEGSGSSKLRAVATAHLGEFTASSLSTLGITGGGAALFGNLSVIGRGAEPRLAVTPPGRTFSIGGGVLSSRTFVIPTSKAIGRIFNITTATSDGRTFNS